MRRRRRLKKGVLLTFLVLVIVGILISPFIIFNIKLIGDKNLVLNYGDKYSEAGYLLNVFGKNLTKDVKVTNNIKNENGTYNVTYTYKFLFYNITKKRNIEVKDIKGPKIELTGGDTVDLVINEEYQELGFIATDNTDGNLTEKVTSKNNIDNKTLGKYQVTYEVVDSNNNKTTKIRTVNVVRKSPSQMSIQEYTLDGWYDNVKVPLTENKGDDYFNSLVMVGDSNMKNMYLYGLINRGKAWAIPCLHAESMHYTKLYIYGTNGYMTLLDAVKANKPEKLILNFGSFSTIWISEATFVAQASAMIEAIQKESPNTEIALISIYPITQYGVNNDNFKQELINKCNFHLLELADKYKLKFLDVSTVLKDSTGYGNPAYYVGDGFHLTSNGTVVVKNYIKTHAF